MRPVAAPLVGWGGVGCGGVCGVSSTCSRFRQWVAARAEQRQAIIQRASFDTTSAAQPLQPMRASVRSCIASMPKCALCSPSTRLRGLIAAAQVVIGRRCCGCRCIDGISLCFRPPSADPMLAPPAHVPFRRLGACKQAAEVTQASRMPKQRKGAHNSRGAMLLHLATRCPHALERSMATRCACACPGSLLSNRSILRRALDDIFVNVHKA